MTPPSTDRGAGPADAELFARRWHGALRAACDDLGWLLGRGYVEHSALELVGNRYELRARQREAVARCAASEDAVRARAAKRIEGVALDGCALAIDAFNLLNTLELAFGGGLVLLTRDGCARDLGGVHGNWRRARQTRPALEAVGETLAEHGSSSARWLIDAPVSNSGRLAKAIREVAVERDWSWTAEIVPHADDDLVASEAVVASADRGVLDGCRRWTSLARAVVASRVPNAWILDLSGASGPLADENANAPAS